MDHKSHWEHIYGNKLPTQVSWYQAHAERSLSLIRRVSPDDGPTRCSGLEVQRYSPDALHAEFGAPFRLMTSEREEHVTPAGVHQAFIYCLCRIDGVDDTA